MTMEDYLFCIRLRGARVRFSDLISSISCCIVIAFWSSDLISTLR